MLNKEWSTAIEGFLVYDRALGKRSTTNSARRQHLQHLARRVTVGPWAVTGDALIDYLGVQGMLGHATPTTTRRYVQWDTAKMRAAVDELAG